MLALIRLMKMRFYHFALCCWITFSFSDQCGKKEGIYFNDLNAAIHCSTLTVQIKLVFLFDNDRYFKATFIYGIND